MTRIQKKDKASSIASITYEGIKKSYDITPPDFIAADLNVLADSPWKLIQSGLGDLLGKVTSLLGWKSGLKTRLIT